MYLPHRLSCICGWNCGGKLWNRCSREQGKKRTRILKASSSSLNWAANESRDLL